MNVKVLVAEYSLERALEEEDWLPLILQSTEKKTARAKAICTIQSILSNEIL